MAFIYFNIYESNYNNSIIEMIEINTGIYDKFFFTKQAIDMLKKNYSFLLEHIKEFDYDIEGKVRNNYILVKEDDIVVMNIWQVRGIKDYKEINNTQQESFFQSKKIPSIYTSKNEKFSMKGGKKETPLVVLNFKDKESSDFVLKYIPSPYEIYDPSKNYENALLLTVIRNDDRVQLSDINIKWFDLMTKFNGNSVLVILESDSIAPMGEDNAINEIVYTGINYVSGKFQPQVVIARFQQEKRPPYKDVLIDPHTFTQNITSLLNSIDN